MDPININKIKIKNILGLIDSPNIEDLLFEIVNFLNDEKRYDGVFNLREVSLKTRCRINTELIDDIAELENKLYVEKLKYTQYKILMHLWN